MFLLSLGFSFSSAASHANYNFATIPHDWGPGYYPLVRQYAFIDDDVTFNGEATLRLDPGGMRDPFGVMDRAIWTDAVAVSVGDNVYVSAWIKTEPSSRGDTIRGARIGIDYYVSGTIVDAVHSDYVYWNTASWTLRDIFVTVPNIIYTQDHLGNSISPDTIDHIIFWIQAQDARDQGSAWYANTLFSVNPADTVWPSLPQLPLPNVQVSSQIPTPTVTPSPTATAIPLLTPTYMPTTAPTPSHTITPEETLLPDSSITTLPTPTFTTLPSPWSDANQPLDELYLVTAVFSSVSVAAVALAVVLKRQRQKTKSDRNKFLLS